MDLNIINSICLLSLLLIMESINVLIIGGDPEDKKDMVELVEDASSFFPTEIWDDIIYIGKLSLEHDFKIKISRESYGAFLFRRLIDRMKGIKDSTRLVSLLLGITADPIVTVYHFFDETSFKKAIYLVHDYVNKKVGVVSLFRVKEDTSSKLVAHGLGHNRGLRHHAEPIDLMYYELLTAPTLEVDGFCKLCRRKLRDEKPDLHPHPR